MTSSPGSRATDIPRAAAPLALAALAAATLFYLSPTQYSFYPQCPVYQSLHLLCPGCGATRALAALLRGHIIEAVRFNALATLMAPVLIAYATRTYVRYLKRDALHLPQLPAIAVYSALAVAAAFTIVRNLAH
jgi:hypothetical protein